MNDGEQLGRSFWVGLGLGWAVMVAGIIGAIATHGQTKPLEVAYRFAELLVVHDGVVAPLAFLVAAVVTHWLPGPARGPVRGALALSAILVVFALPLVQRLGARENSSVLPLAYGPNLAIVLAAVWLVTAAIVAVRLVRTRPQPASAPEPGARGG